jgi:glycosyltransferase involved in cell wall biosynthesis
MIEPLISIIVPTFNREGLLPRTISSLLHQSYKNIEILVQNDAGRDVKYIVDSFDDNRIKYAVNKKNLGLAGTRNQALKRMTGDYGCLLDDDDVYMSYALEFRMYMMKKLNAEIVFTRSLKHIVDKVSLAGEDRFQSVTQELYWNGSFGRDLILVQNVCPCCNTIFSRKSWDDSGNYLFDESMTTTEDHDFWVALSRRHDFIPLDLLDAECLYVRNTKGFNMTGTRDFFPNWIKLFKRWRSSADDVKWVTEHQNNIIRQVGRNPEDYGL